MKNHSESVFLPFRRNFEIFGVEVSIRCFSSQIRNNNGKIMERTKFTVKSIIAISGKHDLVEDVGNSLFDYGSSFEGVFLWF